MGVLREQDEPQLICIEDALEAIEPVINYDDYIFDDSDSESVKVEEVQDSVPAVCAFLNESTKKYFKRDNRYIKCKKPQFVADSFHVKKNMGAKKLRRVEGARLLMNYSDPEDICYDCSDLIPNTINAFSRLFRDDKNMKIWNDFIELDEQEQQRVLNEIDQINWPANKKIIKQSSKASTSTGKVDAREQKSAFSVQACYNKMDKKFHVSFSRNHNLPVEFMEETENKLRSFFLSSTGGVYVELLKSKIKRYYFHAIAQFLFLTSKSFPTDAGPGKMIQVINNHNHFLPPSMCLIQFLQKNTKKIHKVS